MVSGVSSASGYQYQPQMQQSVSLTDDQKAAIEEVVAKYDSSSTSGEDFHTMMEEIKELGFGPSEDVKDILDAAGFEKPEGTPPQGPPPSGGKGEIPDFLSEIFQQKEDGTISQDDFDTIMSNLQSTYESVTGNFIDESV